MERSDPIESFRGVYQADGRARLNPEGWRYLDRNVAGAVQALEAALGFRANHVYSAALRVGPMNGAESRVWRTMVSTVFACLTLFLPLSLSAESGSSTSTARDASLSVSLHDGQLVVPIGYPPGFEEGKREAEGRRQTEEAKAKRVPSGAEEQVTEPAQEQRGPLPGKKERGE